MGTGAAVGYIHYQTEPNSSFLIFSKRDLINDGSSFCSYILLAIDLQRHVLPFEKLLLNVRLCLSVNGIFDDVRYDVIST